MRFVPLFLTVIALLYLVPFAFAEEDNTYAMPADTIGLIYFVPSDRTAQSDINSNIDTWIKDTQTAFADMMETHGYGRKTFTLETDDSNDAVVHHITGDNTDAYYEDASKWDVWDEIKKAGYDPSKNIYIAFVDLSSEKIDDWCGTGGDWQNANGGVVTLPASGDCFVEDDSGELKEVNLIAHELGHALGLRHDYRNHSDISIDALHDGMVTSACAAKWLDGHRYFNSFTSTTTESTTIEMASPSLSGSNASFTFTITDADGLHQAHFFTTRYDTFGFDDLSLLDCKSFDRTSTTATATFTTSTLTFDNNSVTLRVMDTTGSMTEKLFSVNVTALFADVNGDGTIDITDLTEIAGKIGQTGEDRADVNRDGVVDMTDLTLAYGVLGSTITSAPSVSGEELEELLTKANWQKWLHDAQQMNLKDPVFQRGILVLEQLLSGLTTPTETLLLPNYPNPFNPETWIPYQLAKSSDVTVSIYSVGGRLVRTLKLGHQPAGIYKSRSHAAYWDGKNALGESVASGLYFYTLTAGDFTATRKMLIRK